MNDYPDLSHLQIDAMMRAGDPAQAAEWAERARLLGRNLSAAAGELRTAIAAVPAAWSDGTGSSRMISELTAVADHLQLLADLLAGQPASCAGLISEAASALAAAQESSSLPGTGPADRFSTGRRDIALGRLDGRIVLLDAERLAAGERVTMLDERYRTVLARLTPPPQPPRAVLEARGDAGPADQPRPTADATPGIATNPGSANPGSAMHPGSANLGSAMYPGSANLGSAMDPGSANLGSANPGSAMDLGIATHPGIGAAAMVGGVDEWRHTWLVEDRDLYATGPSVQPVIGGA